MSESLFDTIFLFGLVVATVIRTWYGMQLRRKEIVEKEKEHPIVYIDMAI